MIETVGLCKSFRSGRGQVAALDHITLQVAQGCLFVVAGRSGSGKTTLLNCLGTLERPEAGRIICAGTDVTALAGRAAAGFRRERIGFVFQSANLVNYLTVGENIALPLELNRWSPGERERRVAALLDTIGMPGMGAAMPHELSGGEMQRAAFARAIAHTPAILLADEPTASLDTETAGRLIWLMRRLVSETGCTLIAATHDPDLVGAADDGIHLRDGRKADR